MTTESKDRDLFIVDNSVSGWTGLRYAILEESGEIVASIRSKADTPRRCTTVEKTLVDIRTKVEKHIKNTYLKRVDAPWA